MTVLNWNNFHIESYLSCGDIRTACMENPVEFCPPLKKKKLIVVFGWSRFLCTTSVLQIQERTDSVKQMFLTLNFADKIYTLPDYTVLYRKSDLCISSTETVCLVPNSYIHVSVNDLHFPRIGLPIWLQQNRQTDPGNL
jgi:hypothetical protein